LGLSEDLDRIAEVARAHAGLGEELAAVIPAEPAAGARVYLCAYRRREETVWLALDAEGRPLRDRALLRDAVSIAAMCEVAEETAGGGDLDTLRTELRSLRLTESPDGIEEAEAAALELERVLGAPPRLATPAFLDDVGFATRRLEQALGDVARSPFAEAMKLAVGSIEELKLEVEAAYKGPLE
jgi:hypothetical protein